MKTRRLVIVGPAVSGTTLLSRMFYAFEGVDVLPGDRELHELLAAPAVDGWQVGKCPWDSQLDICVLRQFDFVLLLARDGRDVCRRWPVRVGQRAWTNAYADLLPVASMVMKYEGILAGPDIMQERIVAATGMVPTARWSDYPEFVPAQVEQTDNRNADPAYALRPLSDDGIGRGLDPDDDVRAKTMCDGQEGPQFWDMLRRLGYQTTAEEVAA